jgi:DNA topoisomerase-3
MAQKKTLPKPLYTEATLLAAMETCGKNITDEQAKEAIKELGIGTPATRAAIITTLIKRDYIARSGKSIIPTEKGMYIYEAVKDMRVADVELTGSWEKTLAQVERHTLDTETFMQSILDYTRRATEEILRLAGKEDQLTVTVKDGTPEKYSVLDNMMLRLTGIEEPSGWRETLASYMKETGGLE